MKIFTVTRYMAIQNFMMTSSNGNISRVTGPLCGEFTGYRWIPPKKASDAELWCFLLSAPELTQIVCNVLNVSNNDGV